jgi:hypothetical protein
MGSIHEKKQRSEISCYCPFKGLLKWSGTCSVQVSAISFTSSRLLLFFHALSVSFSHSLSHSFYTVSLSLFLYFSPSFYLSLSLAHLSNFFSLFPSPSLILSLSVILKGKHIFPRFLLASTAHWKHMSPATGW